MRKLGWYVGFVGVMCAVQTYLALIWSPPEKQMGDLVRIMYFHVSSAWIAFFAFFVTFVFSLWYLIRRNLKHDAIAVASAEIGVVYTSVTLVTGSLWAKPIWNTWWTWDPRLTTTLILWFLYVGYLLLRGTINGIARRARISAVFAIIAFVDVPIVHMSIQWWNSIHPNVITSTGFNMPGSMVFTLMFGFLSFMTIYILVLVMRSRQELQQRQLLALRDAVRRERALLAERGE